MASFRSLLTILLAVVLMLAGVGLSSHTRASETMSLASGSVISLGTPGFVVAGKRYAFTWAGGGPAQTYTVKTMRPDGWVLVEVADENTNLIYTVPGDFPTRWLNVGMAISIQEMRPHP